MFFKNLMKNFIDDDFLLQTDSAKRLYRDFAKEMPIIDYHCHLPVEQIADDHHFANLSQIWLQWDHYKWRIMRANGVDESYCTGNRSDYEKFEKWAVVIYLLCCIVSLNVYFPEETIKKRYYDYTKMR